MALYTPPPTHPVNPRHRGPHRHSQPHPPTHCRAIELWNYVVRHGQVFPKVFTVFGSFASTIILLHNNNSFDSDSQTSTLQYLTNESSPGWLFRLLLFSFCTFRFILYCVCVIIKKHNCFTILLSSYFCLFRVDMNNINYGYQI